MRARAAVIVLFVGLGTGCGARDDNAATKPKACPAEIARTDVMEPSWAPRSSRVAFSAVERGIFVIDVRTCVVEQVARARFSFTPDWSPDERHIVFDHTLVPGSRSDLLIADLQSGDVRALTQGGDDRFPNWSPHGDQIAFARRADIYVIQADGGGLRRLTSAGDNDQPDWSPDGRKIAWSCDESICTMDADGSHSRRVFEPSKGGAFSDAAWSPDGRSIAFHGLESYDPPVSLMIGPAQGGRIRTFPLLSPEDFADTKPTWSPDGDQIAFVGDDGTWENLYLVRPDDQSDVRALTRSD